jgi:hypothetical protein
VAGGGIHLSADNITLQSGALVSAPNNPVVIDADSISLANAAGVTGGNITIRNSASADLTLGGVGGLSLLQADLDVLSLTDPASGVLTLGVAPNTEFINIASPITFNPAKVQSLALISSNGIAQALTAPLTVDNLLVNGGIGSVDMQALNKVGTLAGSISVLNTASTSRSFLFKNDQALTIGSVGGVDGVSVAFTSALGTSYSADIDISTTSGDLNVNQPIAGKFSNILLCVLGSTCPSLTGTIDLAAGQDINVSRGVRGGSAITLTAGQDINILDLNILTESVHATGAILGPSAASSGTVVMNAERNLTVDNSTISATSLAGGTSAITLTTTTGAIDIKNSSSVTVGHLTSNSGGSASITLDAASGITVSDSTIGAGASFLSPSRGTATVSLNAGSGGVQIANSTISAFAGDSSDGFAASVSVTGNGVTVTNSTISATGGSGFEGSGATGTVTLNAGSGALQIQSGSTLSATGGYGSSDVGGNATVSLTGNSVTVNSSAINATGGSASDTAGGTGSVSITASAGITVSNGTIAALGGSGFTSGVNGGAAAVSMAGGTMVSLTGASTLISATGGMPDGGSGEVQGVATINISATQGAITNTGGLLKVDSATAGSTLTLTARDGIGTTTNPIRLDNDSPDLILNNTGSIGDIAISVATGNFQIDDVIDTLNMNPTGVYYAKAESGNITLAGAFAPAGDPLLAGQSVVFSAPAGSVVFDTGGSVTSGALLKVDAVNISQAGGGSITTLLDATATGSITLQQAASYSLGLLQAGTSITVNSTAGAISDGNGGLNNLLAPTANLTGATGIASVASPLQTQVANLTVSSGSGEIGISNTGNLSLGMGGFGGTDAKIQTSGLLSLGSPISITGNLSLLGNGMTIGQGLTTTGNLALNAGGGNLTISGASVNGANVSLSGGNVSIGGAAASGSTTVTASNAMTITTGGGLTVDGGLGTGASAALDSVAGNTTVTTGGDVAVRGGSGPGAYGSLTGGPDLFMTVGGMVRMDAGSGIGAYAQVASTSPNSIQILFPNLGVGGYFVNGVEYTVFDALSSSGFLAGGVAAILGSNLLISYGLSTPSGLLPPVIETTNTLVDGLLQTGESLISTALQSGRELIAAGGEVLSGVEYIGVWGIVDSVRNEFICR